MPSDHPPVQPIERLLWEHRSLLEMLDALTVSGSGESSGGQCQSGRQVELAVKFMEMHLDSEERFLYPLVFDLDSPVLAKLRGEHRELSRISDSIPALVDGGDWNRLRDTIGLLKKELSAHFGHEETGIFVTAGRILSPAQVDILKIKFATRSIS